MFFYLYIKKILSFWILNLKNYKYGNEILPYIRKKIYIIKKFRTINGNRSNKLIRLGTLGNDRGFTEANVSNLLCKIFWYELVFFALIILYYILIYGRRKKIRNY